MGDKKSRQKEEKHSLLSWPKILMMIGAIAIIGVGIASWIWDLDTSIFGSKDLSRSVLIMMGITFILIPLSVKPDFWSTVWALIITTICVLFFIGYFVNTNPDYSNPALWLSLAPYIFMAVGSLSWIFWND
ncbi:hypothetical protein [Spiroplasma endosymbiont of Amphibalanus improvisus]|uniref:hypothetical protein n=1 Tax=Spiroplasma endosymbiont of Amphibalanus improvisus TaxID=3066327 RepID=UPI00313C85D5